MESLLPPNRFILMNGTKINIAPIQAYQGRANPRQLH